MKIRRKLKSNETLVHLKDYKELFLGECCGVALVKRGVKDPHICFIRLIEDDGNWFSRANITSSYWLEDEMTVLKAVKKWLQKKRRT